MPGFDHSVLTDVGWDALTDAEAGQHIEYTHLEAGDGYVYGGDEEIFGMTDLKNKIMDFPITNFSNDGQGQITLVGVISSKNVTTGFNFREIGVRCTIDGGPSILYAVANSGDEADYIPSSAESGIVIQTVQIIIKIDRATNVTVIITPGLDVTAQNIGPGTVGPGWFRDKQSQVLWFKRLNSPKNTIDLIETSDLISIDVPTIDIDLDMFVALGNPDIFPHFSTIQRALDYLTPFAIKAGKTVTITVSPGVWHNSSVVVKHIQSSQIKIIGTAGPVKTNITSASFYGDRRVALNSSSAFGLSNGEYFLYENTGTVGGICISGVHRVVEQTTNMIAFDSWFQGPLPSLGGVSGGTLTPIKTILSAPSSISTGFHVQLDLGLLKHVVLTWDDTASSAAATGLHCTRGTAACEKVGIIGLPGGGPRGFLIGVTGSLNASHCCATNCQYGFSGYASGGMMTLDSCFATSNWTAGFFMQQTPLNATICSAGGNAYHGFWMDGSYVTLIQPSGYNNNSTGITSSSQSHVSVMRSSGASAAGVFTGNSYRDINISRLSDILRVDTAPIYYNSTNIAPNTLSYDGCFFSP
jgi:Phage tail-collar fibre protein